MPSITLPKGGGAIRGIGEKFTASPVTGTGSMSVPIATSPGRSGFGPQLGLSYDSGAGNGAFGIGWNLAVPAVTRKTDKGLPLYRDAEESDVFILSGAEDLVPVDTHHAEPELRNGYLVKAYRPRIEGLFARIERWTRRSDGDTHWRSISKDNVLSVYGLNAESRIADPANPSHVFSWLVCQSYDDKGNAIVYEYVAENADCVDLTQANERNRVRSANRYLKYIRYGNRQPVLVDPARASFRQSHVPAPDLSAAGWMFEIVFDYGEGHYQELPADADGRIYADVRLAPPAGGKWTARLDPFSTYRSGFELRSYRLCRRILMFHHFPAELGVDDYLVRSTELAYHEKPNGTFVAQVLQSGFKRIASATAPYLKRSLPPLEFAYSVSPLDDLTFDRLPLQGVDERSLENLPAGIDANMYRWVDLDGEGIAGVLCEQGDAWFYKPNLGEAQFGPVECVSPRPSLAALTRGRQQLMGLAGDGSLDLVDLAEPTPGFFARTEDAGWDGFHTFSGLPNIDWQDPNLRFIDLTGDGLADVLVTDDQVCTWHESYAEAGFGPANRVFAPFDEEDGPRLVFADSTQSVFLADMSGDGLSDLVRIRVSDVCYWPNTGYGRFGAKVTLDDAPWFDDAESFDQRRVHLADTDGSGPTDIVYLGRDGIRVYLNQHGNSLSRARLLSQVPRPDNLSSVSVVDFLGRGTACIVWSSPLPGDARRPLRYLDLMGGVKPHLLTHVRNNLGAETRIEYASSTHFYLADKAAGTPWITRLPFPVHVVTEVETRDLISGNRFTLRSAYHHGYFDGVEREFRGFGRVDQWDTEEFGVLFQPGAATPGTNLDPAFYVPPTLTKTWFHTGAYIAGARISRHLEHEYYRERELSPTQREAMLLDDTVLPADLAIGEAREAIRSLKGAILRQEVYALDSSDAADRPYSFSERNFTIRPIQRRGANRHSIFFTHARETIDFHYERQLFPVLDGQVVHARNSRLRWLADPRVTHTLTLQVDDFGNVRQAATIGYGRRFDDTDPVLTDVDRHRQRHLQVTLTDASFTNAVLAPNAYRTPLAAETRTYELIGLRPTVQQPDITNLFRFDEMLTLAAQAGDGAHDLPYEDVHATGARGTGVYRRMIEDLRTRYRANDLSQLLPLGTLQALAVMGETYKLAFTPGLLSSVYAGRLPDPAAVLTADTREASDRGAYVDLDGDGHWWIPSGRVYFHPSETASATAELLEASSHFFVPRRFRNPFARSSYVDYAHDLLPARTRDALNNTVEGQHEYRVLQARQLTDPNGNRSFAAFDAFGLTVATATRGKHHEPVGDSLDDFGDLDADPGAAELQAFVARPADLKAALLKDATNRFVYDLDRFYTYGQPPFAATLVRESHVSDPLPPQGLQIQVGFAYSDAFGRELQSKIQAEPDAATPADPRWVGKGRTIYNNKGNPVKQYEPFFSSTHLYESEPEIAESGVTLVRFYDPLDRVVATLHPNHTFEKIVFDPWRQATWDVNDTVTVSDPRSDPDVGEFFRLLPTADYLPTWYDQRRKGQQGPVEKAAAERAAAHAGTPTLVYVDSLGRPILTIADNGPAQKFATRMTLDLEGNQREVSDALNRAVMRYDYDLLGNRIHQSSMEAGQRWMVNDVAGKPIRAWDSRAHNLRTTYDALRRPVRSFVTGADAQDLAREICFEETVYGESAGNTGLTSAEIVQANLRGKPYKHFDTAGIVTSDAYDFKGNLLRSTRQLTTDYQTTPDWARDPRPALDAEIFANSIRYDALNRPIQVRVPHNVIRPGYNAANLLERVDVWLGEAAEPGGLLDPTSANLHAVTNFDYNAKGQRTRVDFGNGALTEYTYDDKTFRLIHLKTTHAAPSPGGRAVFQDLAYTYDPVGNMIHIGDAAQQRIYFNGEVVAPHGDYAYDAIYRLVNATGREHIGQFAQPQSTWNDEFRIDRPQPGDGQAMRNYTEHYLYDAVGNLEQLIHHAANGNWTRTYAYSEASLNETATTSNRLSGTSVGATTETYTYDAHGNMTSMPHLTLMQWDFKDQLSASSQQHANASNVPETTYFVYDAGGQRVRKVTERHNGSRKAERIYLDIFEMYREFAGNGNDVGLERQTLHVMDNKQRVAMVETRTHGNDGSPVELIRYQFGNHLGSASLELNSQASVISYEEYTPYGSTSYQAVDRRIHAAAKRYRYTGKERDTETGFNYHGLRYCSPWLGRWLSLDPAGTVDGLNLYQYCRGNPITFVDPIGTQTDADPLKDRVYAGQRKDLNPGSGDAAGPGGNSIKERVDQGFRKGLSPGANRSTGPLGPPGQGHIDVISPDARAALQKPEPPREPDDRPCLVVPPPVPAATGVKPVPGLADIPSPDKRPQTGPTKEAKAPAERDPSLAQAPKLDPANDPATPRRRPDVGLDINADPAARVNQVSPSPQAREGDVSDITDQPAIDKPLDQVQDKAVAVAKKDLTLPGAVAFGVVAGGGLLAGLQSDPQSPAGSIALKPKVLPIKLNDAMKIRLRVDFRKDTPPDPNAPPSTGFPSPPDPKFSVELHWAFKGL